VAHATIAAKKMLSVAPVDNSTGENRVMWWGRNRRRKTLGIRSLVERLKALEDATDRPSSAMSAVGQAVHTNVTAGRLLIRWFSLGFAFACIAGVIALVASLAAA
jgi:hypothetical protein